MDAPSCQGCRGRDARIVELEARVADLEAKLQEQARLIVDLAKKLQDRDLPKSGTPGPPDPSKPPVKKPSPRKPGGQPGHPPHLKQMLPPERVSETVRIIPDQCDHCQHTLPSGSSSWRPIFASSPLSNSIARHRPLCVLAAWRAFTAG